MTAVVATEYVGGAWIACDSFIGDDSQSEEIDHPKLFRKGGMVFGWAGEMRPAQLVEYAATFRPIKPHEDALAYLVRVVVEGIGTAYVNGLFETDTHKTDYLVVLRGRVYTIQEDLSVVRNAHGYAAIGAGAGPALHAFAANTTEPPRDRVLGALRSAAKHCTKVRGRFHDLNVVG